MEEIGLCPVCPFAIPLDKHGLLVRHNNCKGNWQIPLPAEDWRHTEYYDNLTANIAIIQDRLVDGLDDNEQCPDVSW